MNRIAVYPGSFDPVTIGHLDLIRRAAGLFDQVIVAILHNSEKKSPLFSVDERVIMLQDACKNIENVQVECFEGLLIEYVRSWENRDETGDLNPEQEENERNHVVIIRGLRELMDFDMELQMAQVNRIASAGRETGENGIETLFLPTDPKYSHVSSSVVREYARYGMPLQDFVPENVLRELEIKMN